MATIGYFLRSNSDNASIYCRLTIDRNNRFEKKTGLTIQKNDWSKDTRLPKRSNSNDNAERKKYLDGLNNDLVGLRLHIQKKANHTITNGKLITSDWLALQIEVYFGLADESGEDDSVIGVFDRYIKNLKKDDKASNTIKGYKYSRKKFLEFQGKKTYRIKDVTGLFAEDYLDSLKNNLGEGTANKVLRQLITICKYGGFKYEFETSKSLNGIDTKRANKKHKIHLDPKELLQIEKANIVSDYLQNARKWLLLASEIGIRISDTKHIHKNNLVEYDGMEFLQFMPTKQRKNKDTILVTIPVVGKVRELLNDGFPRPISHQKLNEYIKEVCKISGINTPTKGEKRISKNGLNIEGTYPKWELITFHCMRYSFITNSKNIINNQMVRTITGHQSDRMLEHYQKQEYFKDAKIVGDIMQKKYEERTAPMAINE